MIVVAVQPFTYQGHRVVTDDVCVVTPVEAAALVRQRHVRFPDDDEGYGAYQRRDLIAQDTPSLSRRRSRRRDLTADA